MTIDLTAELMPMLWTLLALGLTSGLAILVSPLLAHPTAVAGKKMVASPAHAGAC
jgi:hypothetical protein